MFIYILWQNPAKISWASMHILIYHPLQTSLLILLES